jgi:hypothetical protein
MMDAFGRGKYTQISDFTFQAKFGGRIHTLTFNEDYTKFTSIRKNDNLSVIGELLKK